MPEIAGLYWESHGPDDAPPLIMSAGLGGSGGYWKPNLGAFANDYRVILYDHRGTGKSDRALPAAISVDDLADDIMVLMDGIGIESASLIGHAAGGVAGLALALKAPERLKRLIVVNGWARPDPHFARCFEARLAIYDQGGAEAYLRAQPIFLYPANWISEHHAELEVERAEQLAHFQSEGVLRARIAALTGFDIGNRLGAIKTPVLAIAADDDILVPNRCSAVLVEGLQENPACNSRLARMATGGHACNIISPREFENIALDWLSDRVEGE